MSLVVIALTSPIYFLQGLMKYCTVVYIDGHKGGRR
jgi:hypothetical protein